ncbi:uncharacterized protein LOC142597879 [Dermatophagoides farinae]|uniref:uncharacterized protein LOC142597879 n=1 Tax=Dermatophagoides farinae TaxID=6954 RepID=UPI003F6108B3
MVTGSSDCTVKIWDLLTVTPITTFKRHIKPITSIAISPCCRYVASGANDNLIYIWDVSNLKSSSTVEPLTKIQLHKQPITALEFLPAHLHKFWINKTPLLASASQDGSIRISNIISGQSVANFDGHTKMVTCLRWSGNQSIFDEGKEYFGPILYSSSRDTMIKIWSLPHKQMIKSVKAHAHWINGISLNTSYLMNCSAFFPSSNFTYTGSIDAYFQASEEIWNKQTKNIRSELLVSSSDDNTLVLWDFNNESKKIAQLLGHQQPVCGVSFSPDARYICSASFDSSLRLWCGTTGKYLHVFRGHVAAVYQLAWSSDSRLVVSCGKDSTIKTWDVQSKKLRKDLPGAADELYCIDWAINGQYIGSGGKDKIVRIWSR